MDFPSCDRLIIAIRRAAPLTATAIDDDRDSLSLYASTLEDERSVRGQSGL
jgi:hypothetical protein